MPNTAIVATATKQQNNTSKFDAQAAFIKKMTTKIQQQMFEITRNNLGM